MWFASPIWLLALIPWGMLVGWFLVGRSPATKVPFIELWKDESVPERRVREALRFPPAPIVCALLALLFGLLAAGRPQMLGARSGAITAIFDRGASMSGLDYQNSIQTITHHFGYPSNVRLIPAAGESFDAEFATGLQTRDALQAALHDALRGDDRPIVVVTNQAIETDANSSRVAIIVPPVPQNVGIVSVSAHVTPKPAILVRVRNQSDQTRATVQIRGDDAALVDQSIALPVRGRERDYFYDLNASPQVVSVALEVADGLPADNRAWLVRGNPSPIVETQAAISPELSRFLEIYHRHHPASEHSNSVTLTDNALRLPPDKRGVVISNSSTTLGAATAVHVAEHPITAHVGDWTRFATNAKSSPPGDGWRPLVQAGESIVVAVREQPARQVWVAPLAQDFARSPEFVIFWTDVLDWVGAADSANEYRSEPVTDDALHWTRDEKLSGPPTTAAPSPGVYRSDDGTMHALNAINIHLPATQPASDPRANLENLAAHLKATSGAIDLAPAAIILALVTLVFAAITWPAHRRTVPVSGSA